VHLFWNSPFKRQEIARFPPKPIKEPTTVQPAPSTKKTVTQEPESPKELSPPPAAATKPRRVMQPVEEEEDDDDEEEEEHEEQEEILQKKPLPSPPRRKSSQTEMVARREPVPSLKKRLPLSPVPTKGSPKSPGKSPPRKSATLQSQQQFEGLAITIAIERLDLLPIILDNPMLESVAVALEFLQAPTDPISMFTAFVPAASNPFEYDFRRDFALSEYSHRIKLFSVMTSGHRSDAVVIFDVCNRTGNQLHIIGSAEVNLHAILGARADLISADVDVIDTSLIKVGTLTVSITAYDALQAILDSSRTLASTLPTIP
jgi:hypothetical protein